MALPDDPSASPPGPLLAVDFGERRVGLAISDPERRLALPLATVERRNDRQAIAAVRDLARREGATGLLVGEPRRLDGTTGEAAARARGFGERLADALGLSCTFADEALTSVAAEERLREAGIDPRRHRERVDQVAAQILLEDHLASGGGR